MYANAFVDKKSAIEGRKITFVSPGVVCLGGKKKLCNFQLYTRPML